MISKLKAVLDDDRGVSPVIGVILMVAITVILAAVIGTFVLGLGDSLEQAPQAQLDAEINADDELQITHNGGDALPEGDLDLTINGGAAEGYFTSGSEFTVGQSQDTNIAVTSTDRIRIIHTPSDSIILDITL